MESRLTQTPPFDFPMSNRSILASQVAQWRAPCANTCFPIGAQEGNVESPAVSLNLKFAPPPLRSILNLLSLQSRCKQPCTCWPKNRNPARISSNLKADDICLVEEEPEIAYLEG